MRSLRAKAILAALSLVLLTAPPSHAEVHTSAASVASTEPSESETGGFAYQPLPNQASPVNRGSIPGESGGASYNPDLQRRKSRRVPARRRRFALPGRPTSELSSEEHRFPVQGPHSFGGADGRFGARRPGHVHQGQDITAAEGTPVVAPRGGTILWTAYQAQGAGYYIVLDAVGEAYNYVFMHLERGSIGVRVGERVRTGQMIARVGSSGTASGPHLHFEIWNGPWYKGGAPIDPLPVLLAWDRFS